MSSRVIQYFTMLSGSIMPILTSINLGWPSPYLPVLDMNNPEAAPLKLTSDEQFWCSVMPLLGAPFGAFLAALLVDRIGRKYLLLALSPIYFACYIAIGFTHSIAILDLARFLAGSVEGATFTTLPMYYGEIADSKIRGVLSSSIMVAAALGGLLINIVGSYTSIFLSSIICCMLSAVHFFTFMWMPRSPYYLIKKERLEEAKRSLRRLRGTTEIEEEFSDILFAVKRQEAISKKRKTKYSDLFTEPGNRKAVVIYLVLCLTNKFCGMTPLILFAHSIFNEIKDFLKPEISVITLHSSAITFVIIGMLIVDKFGRRPLMLFSALGGAISLGFFSIYCTMQYFNMEIVKQLNWLPLISMISFMCTYSIGIRFGAVVLLSELFPTSIKSYACGSADTISVISTTIATKIYHGLSLSLGMYVPFWFFTGCGLMGTIMIYIYLPETKGKTLEEIQLELTGQRQSSDNAQD